MAEVSIIIVNFNTGNLLAGALESIQRSVNVDYEVIVVDNASTDGSVEALPHHIVNDSRVKIIKSPENLGFAKANNLGVASATGAIYHFLNPDTEVNPDCGGGDGSNVEAAGNLNDDYRYALENRDKVYINSLINRDGSLENDPMPIPLFVNLLKWNFARSRAKIWYKGASVIISRENFNKIGGWSQEYFLYAEDLDLFYKINRCSLEIAQLPSPIFHLGGGSSSRLWSNLERAKIVERSNRIFYKRYSSMFEYNIVKMYYLCHYMLKRPSSLGNYIRAWFSK